MGSLERERSRNRNRDRNRYHRVNTPPRSFTFTPARSTVSRANQVTRWMDKYIKMDPPPCDPRSGIRGLERIPGGIEELVTLDRATYQKYLQAFFRRLKPDMFEEPLDLLCELRDRKGNYKPPSTTYKLYKWGSYETNTSALVSALNRLSISQHTAAINASTTAEARDAVNPPNIVNINDGEWIGIKAIRTKVVKVLFAHCIRTNALRQNKEEHSMGVKGICMLFQNIDSLAVGMKPIVCLFCICNNKINTHA